MATQLTSGWSAFISKTFDALAWGCGDTSSRDT